MRIMYTNASIIGLSPSSLHVLERSFYMGYKWILANLSMTRGKIWWKNHSFVLEERAL